MARDKFNQLLGFRPGDQGAAVALEDLAHKIDAAEHVLDGLVIRQAPCAFFDGGELGGAEFFIHAREKLQAGAAQAGGCQQLHVELRLMDAGALELVDGAPDRLADAERSGLGLAAGRRGRVRRPGGFRSGRYARIFSACSAH